MRGLCTRTGQCVGTQPESHTRHAGAETETGLEACARLIPLLSTLPGHPTRAPTGCQPPPLGRRGLLGTGRALGPWHLPASAGSSPAPVPGAASPLSMRWGGKGLPVPSLTHGQALGTARQRLARARSPAPPPQPARLPGSSLLGRRTRLQAALAFAPSVGAGSAGLRAALFVQERGCQAARGA